MDNPLLSPIRTNFSISPLPPDFVERVRRTGRDDFGNLVHRFRSHGGGEPCRCLLRRANPGDEVILCSYRPFATGSLFAEVGPIYLFADPDLPAGVESSVLPPGYFKGRFVLRAYSSCEEIVTASLISADDFASTLTTLFDNDQVAFVHARFAAYGCFGCRIERQPSSETTSLQRPPRQTLLPSQ